jgi:hypothetical protein
LEVVTCSRSVYLLWEAIAGVALGSSNMFKECIILWDFNGPTVNLNQLREFTSLLKKQLN